MKAKKDDLGYSVVNHSCSSISKKHEHRSSTEHLLQDGTDKAHELALKKPSNDGQRRNDSGNYDSPFQATCGSPVRRNTTTAFSPSFQEITFDFLDIPKHKLTKSFLSNSISRVFGGKTHIDKTPGAQLLLDVHSTYPLYSRRGAVAPGSVTSRSLSSTLYDSTTSNIPYCVRRSMEVVRQKQRLKRAGKWNSTRKCLSNAELHLVCFHHCNEDANDGASKPPSISKKSASIDDCSCKPDVTPMAKPRQAKSCSELNDILQSSFFNNYLNRSKENLASSGDITQVSQHSENVQFSSVAITINGCSEEGVVPKTNVNSETGSHKTKERFLTPQTAYS